MEDVRSFPDVPEEFSDTLLSFKASFWNDLRTVVGPSGIVRNRSDERLLIALGEGGEHPIDHLACLVLHPERRSWCVVQGELGRVGTHRTLGLPVLMDQE